uniref:Uncharacterized protein n=1 Tax=Cacopsylla melanoneura TaxID=428564 RepID=A0A8D9E708_9HEMI
MSFIKKQGRYLTRFTDRGVILRPNYTVRRYVHECRGNDLSFNIVNDIVGGYKYMPRTNIVHCDRIRYNRIRSWYAHNIFLFRSRGGITRKLEENFDFILSLIR